MDRIDKIRTRVTLGEREAVNVASSDFPDSYTGYDDAWNQAKFEKNFRIDIIRIEDQTMEFDMVGIDAAIANAFRRILLAEVPSMAFDKIMIMNNTSIMSDEMLAHRLGLIPIKADPRHYEYKNEDSTEGTEEDTIAFKLHVKCSHNPNACKGATDPKEVYMNSSVYAKDLKWIPIGNQSAISKVDAPRPVDEEIIIVNLRPGQEIDLVAHCVKGIGKDHMKFSPVATAFYRQLPEIILLKEVSGEAARLLRSCFSKGVIKIDNINGKEVARVADSRRDMLSRNYLKYEDLKDCVEINLVRNHFIFSVESTGALPPQSLVLQAIKILVAKCKHLIQEIDDMGNS